MRTLIDEKTDKSFEESSVLINKSTVSDRSPEISQSNRLLLPKILLNVLYEQGVNVYVLANDSGVDASVLTDSIAEISTFEYICLIKSAFKYMPQGSMTLSIAKTFRIEQNCLIGNIANNSTTLYDAIKQICKYSKLLGNTELAMEVQGDLVKIRHLNNITQSYCPKHDVEGIMGYIIFLSRHITKRNIFPSQVNFEFDRPTYASAFKSIYGPCIAYNKNCNEIVFQKKSLLIPVINSDSIVLEKLVAKANRLMNEISHNAYIKDSIYHILRSYDLKDVMTIADVANKLCLSPRSLQRKLKDEGTCFNKLVDKARYDRAVKLLVANNLNTKTVAHELGYKSVTAFYGAFKRWTGCTPKTHIRQIPQ